MTDRSAETGAPWEGQLDKARIAYIKPTSSDEAHRLGLLPENVELPDGMTLYVVHAADGSVIGYTDAYASAYGAAVENELTPMSVH